MPKKNDKARRTSASKQTAGQRERVDNDHQKTVQGKNQRGPEDKIGRDAGGNSGSKGQNLDSRRRTGTGREPGDVGTSDGRGNRP